MRHLPGNDLVERQSDNLVEHIGFSIRIGLVARIHIIGSIAGLFNHRSEFLINCQQFGIRDVIGLGIRSGVPRIIITISLLAEEVLRITVVGTPCINIERRELRIAHFLGNRGNISLDIEGHEIISKAVGEHLLHDVGIVQCSLVGCLDVIVDLYREGHALGREFFNRLGLVLIGLSCIVTGKTRAVSLDAQLIHHTLGILRTVGEGDQIGHGIGIVGAVLRIDIVRTSEVRGQIQTVVPCLTEALVGNGSIPVGVRLTVFKILIPAEMDLIGELGRAGFDKVVVVLVGGVVIDGVQVGFGKRDIIDLTSLEHLESDILGLDHLVGHGIKQRAVRIPVKGVLRKHLFVCIDVR